MKLILMDKAEAAGSFVDHGTVRLWRLDSHLSKSKPVSGKLQIAA
jgi:hypothetical protein